MLAMTLCFVLAHNVLYTYIAPLLAGHRMTAEIDSVLLVFGGAALVSVGLTGVLIDKWLRPIDLHGIGLFLVAVLILAVDDRSAVGDLRGRTYLGDWLLAGRRRSFRPHRRALPVVRPTWPRR